jgi:hypothetical protein
VYAESGKEYRRICLQLRQTNPSPQASTEGQEEQAKVCQINPSKTPLSVSSSTTRTMPLKSEHQDTSTCMSVLTRCHDRASLAFFIWTGREKNDQYHCVLKVSSHPIALSWYPQTNVKCIESLT